MFKLKTIIALFVCALLVNGCAGKSDSLGLEGASSFSSYAETYQPARKMLTEGKMSELLTQLQKNSADENGDTLTDARHKEKLIANNSDLSLIERGLLTLNSGDYKRALLYFDAAEAKMEMAEKNLAEGVGKGVLTALTGVEEVTDYQMRGYERVMLYNYKALCYMLLGDRKAYNVTRRAIDKQQEEWELFNRQIEAVRAEENKKLAEQGTQSGELEEGDTRDKYTKAKAASVASAYVNPFGDYMNAMIMEIDSLQNNSLRDNASIAYGNVIKNNKQCSMAVNAREELKSKTPPAGKKLVHVVLSDGFSPERQVHTSTYRLNELEATVSYTQATSFKSEIFGAKAGNVKLSPLSDMEAIILRDDQDRAPLRSLMFAAAILRSGTANYFGGSSLMDLVSKVQKPDTRSWLSLPGKIMVARLYVPVGQKNLELQTVDAKGRMMNTTSVNLAAKGPTVIYAVSYDKQLSAYANKGSWVEE